jgi:hypothetical protein
MEIVVIEMVIVVNVMLVVIEEVIVELMVILGQQENLEAVRNHPQIHCDSEWRSFSQVVRGGTACE